RASADPGPTTRSMELDDTDVGARAHIDAPVTQLGTVLGTPAYMSPEQLRGLPADARSDQFSFSIAVYEALYGDRPFAGETLLALASSIQTGRVKPIGRRVHVPRGVLPVLVRGLAATPEARWSSMDALLAALDRAASS